MQADVKIVHEVKTNNEGSWNLCFQWVIYQYSSDKENESGYRFIWRREDGTLQPARGQARIPSADILISLIKKAIKGGWFINAENDF